MAAKDTFTVRMRPDLKLQVQARAEAEGRSFANMLERLVEGALTERGREATVDGRGLATDAWLGAESKAERANVATASSRSVSALTGGGTTEGRGVANTVPQPGALARPTERVAGSPPPPVSASAGGKVFRGPDVKAPGRKIRK